LTVSIRRSVFAIASAIALVAACRESATPDQPVIRTSANAQAPSASASSSQVANGSATRAFESEPWDCRGNLFPPENGQQGTAFRPAKDENARAVASKDAKDALKQRFCAGQMLCDFLEQRISVIKTGANERDVCAMAFLPQRFLDEWRLRTEARIDDALDAAAKDLVVGLQADMKPGVPQGTVIIDRVQDAGVPGGPRADWLLARMEHALQKASVRLGVAPRSWAGELPVSGVDMVVRGSVTERAEAGVLVLEASWEGFTRAGRRVRGRPVVFPAAASPHVVKAPPASTRMSDATGLSLRVEAMTSGRASGSLCPGERAQLWLNLAKASHVRVLNLYGNGEAMLIFPNADHPSGALGVGSAALGGKDGFEAIPSGTTDFERYLVIAADSEADLGDLAGPTRTCTFSPPYVRSLESGAGLPPKARVVWTGYRIASGAECGPAPSPSRMAAMERAIAALPKCAP